jgi:hypothetical protein
VEQHGGTEEFRRLEALMAVAFVSIRDPQFLSGARNNLESTLWLYGFALSPHEMEEVREYFGVRDGLSDREIIDALEGEFDPTRDRRWSR